MTQTQPVSTDNSCLLFNTVQWYLHGKPNLKGFYFFFLSLHFFFYLSFPDFSSGAFTQLQLP